MGQAQTITIKKTQDFDRRIRCCTASFAGDDGLDDLIVAPHALSNKLPHGLREQPTCIDLACSLSTSE
jgi:hypothetical protein